MKNQTLDYLLSPNSIALVGASPKHDSNGLAMYEMCKIDGFDGSIFLVNPNYTEINGVKCYASIKDLSVTPDHVVIGIASRFVEEVFEQCVELGVKAVTIFASCFLKNDSKPNLAERLKGKALKFDIDICGPNCMGFYNPGSKLRVASFPSPEKLTKGGISWIAQSGSAFGALAHNDRRLGFNLCVSTGMELKTTATDYLQWALTQENTKVVGLFLESIRDPKKFVRVLKEAVLRKIPVVVLKVGKTEKSAQMALSHTGALVGNHVVYEALFRTYGVIEVHDMDEMAATLALFDLNKPISDGDLVTIHDSGGERELVVDLCDQLSIDYAEISAETKNQISTQLEPGLIAENPIDIFGTNNNYIERYSNIIAYLANDKSTAICLFMANPRDGYWYAEGYVEAVKVAAQNTSKVVVLVSNFSLVNEEKMAGYLFDHGVPLIRGTKNALLAVKHALNWRNYLSNVKGDLKSINKQTIINEWAKKLSYKKDFSEFDGLEMLREFGVSVPGYKLLNNKIDLLSSIDELSFPLVLKTAESINHKSDVNGVKLNLSSKKAVVSEYECLIRRLGPRALLMEMQKGSVEICVGAIIDDDFGPVIVLSAGGTLIEVINDTISALAPIDPQTAKQLLLELNISKMFNGVRGHKPVNLEDLCNQISSISFMIFDLGDNLKELDINPIICSESGAWAVDCLAIGNSH
jgi:acyl-CoA synthetase (NDP forming)